MALISLQSAASGLSALNTALDVIANNLANVNTAGFKASRANFEDLLYIEQSQPGVRNINDDQRPMGLQVGLGVKVSGTELDFTPGNPIKGNKLDIYVQGNGFLRVEVQDGLSPNGIAYTRAGQLALNSDGELVLATDQGRRIADNIVIDGDVEDIEIDANGNVLIKRPGESQFENAGQLTLANFVNPWGLTSLGENLYADTDASGPPIEGEPGEDAFGTILQGYYESSNVDPTNELINMIRVQRAFEMNSNTIRAADEVLRSVAQLRR
jgi:flagellar basal-body rod protein FlgG